jgi:hypothetical protein
MKVCIWTHCLGYQATERAHLWPELLFLYIEFVSNFSFRLLVCIWRWPLGQHGLGDDRALSGCLGTQPVQGRDCASRQRWNVSFGIIRETFYWLRIKLLQSSDILSARTTDSLKRPSDRSYSSNWPFSRRPHFPPDRSHPSHSHLSHRCSTCE